MNRDTSSTQLSMLSRKYMYLYYSHFRREKLLVAKLLKGISWGRHYWSQRLRLSTMCANSVFRLVHELLEEHIYADQCIGDMFKGLWELTVRVALFPGSFVTWKDSENEAVSRCYDVCLPSNSSAYYKNLCHYFLCDDQVCCDLSLVPTQPRNEASYD